MEQNLGETLGDCGYDLSTGDGKAAVATLVKTDVDILAPHFILRRNKLVLLYMFFLF